MRILILTLFLSCFTSTVFAQYASEYDKGYVVKLNADGQKYIRFILFGQAWFQDNEGQHQNDGFSVKRARVLTYAQINERFLILTHFGANNIAVDQLSPTGQGNGTQLFLHELLLQFKVNDYLYLGGGIHNYGGISRGNGQGSINMLTLDNNRADWPTLGLSDQALSHLGAFAKGNIERWNYRLSISNAAVNTLDGNMNTVVLPGEEKYLGRALLNESKYAYAGYFDYQFLEQESNLLPYRVGTYLGNKRVLNVGAGFFSQNDAIVKNDNGQLVGKDVRHFAIDVFYDKPLGKSSAVTAYAKYQYSNMGDNYLQGTVVGNGQQWSGHIGWLVPKHIKAGESINRNRLQPYVAYSFRDFSGLPKPAQELKLGANWYMVMWSKMVLFCAYN